MTGDRSGYRKFYPRVLSFNEDDVQRSLKQDAPSYTDPDEYRDYLKSLAEDAQRIRDGVCMIPWPIPDDIMIDSIRSCVVSICMLRFAQVSKIPEVQGKLASALHELGIEIKDWTKTFAELDDVITNEEFVEIKKIYQWDEVFLAIPVRRLQSALQWKMPFDAVEASLSEANYPVMQCDLDEMHTQIIRGHNWYGVGEWNIANRHYLNALSVAIATNNCIAIEAAVRFLVDVYVANGDSQSAVNITNDFLNSAAYQQSPTKTMTRDMFEAIAVAFALERRLDASREWIQKIPGFCVRPPNSRVAEWSTVQLLAEVYKFRQDKQALYVLSSAIREISRLL